MKTEWHQKTFHPIHLAKVRSIVEYRAKAEEAAVGAELFREISSAVLGSRLIQPYWWHRYVAAVMYEKSVQEGVKISADEVVAALEYKIFCPLG